MFKIDEKVLDRWLPCLEGTGEWASYASACPKVARRQIPLLAHLFENVINMSGRKGITESVDSPANLLTEATVSGDATAGYSPILIPMLRRVMPALIGPRIFGTQPMIASSGLVFYMKARFQNDSVNPVKGSNSVILVLADASTFAVGGAVVQGGTSTGDGVGVCRYIEGNNVLVQVTSGTFVAGAGEEVDNANPYVAAETTISSVFENEALFNIIFKNYSGTYTTAAGEALSTDMKEMGYDVASTTVTARTRKLKAKWTKELEEDMAGQHHIDAAALLSSIASDELILEMNKEFMDLARATATNTSSYVYGSVDGRWESEKYTNLIASMIRGKRFIGQTSRVGQGTWAIVSPSVLSALEVSGKLDDNGIDPVATVFAGRALGMDIIVDNYATNDNIIIGYKGATELNSGIFYCPWIPLQITSGLGEEDGQPRSFFRTRYGLLANPFGAENFFHTINVSGLPV